MSKGAREGAACGAGPRAMSGRFAVQKLAAHIAHLLNGDDNRDGEADGKDQVVTLAPFALFQAITKTLARAPYAQAVVGHYLVAGRMEADEAGQRYFESVLDREMFLARSEPTHKAHKLFLALARRGTATGWQDARLVRSPQPPGVAATMSGPPRDFAHLAGAIARIGGAISPSNPAARTRKLQGPLWLYCHGHSLEVAEELSVWGAISTVPIEICKLRQGEPFNRFCSVVIKALEAANAQFGAILSLGVSPFDWADAITVNTAKKASSFLRAAEKRAQQAGGGGHALAHWEAAWQTRQVPGFADAGALWRSELGLALRGAVPRVSRLDGDVGDVGEVGIAGGGEAQFLERSAFFDQLKLARDAGAVTAYEYWLMAQLYDGASFADLERAGATLAEFGETPPDWAKLAEALNDKLQAFAAAQH